MVASKKKTAEKMTAEELYAAAILLCQPINPEDNIEARALDQRTFNPQYNPDQAIEYLSFAAIQFGHIKSLVLLMQLGMELHSYKPSISKSDKFEPRSKRYEYHSVNEDKDICSLLPQPNTENERQLVANRVAKVHRALCDVIKFSRHHRSLDQRPNLRRKLFTVTRTIDRDFSKQRTLDAQRVANTYAKERSAATLPERVAQAIRANKLDLDYLKGLNIELQQKGSISESKLYQRLAALGIEQTDISYVQNSLKAIDSYQSQFMARAIHKIRSLHFNSGLQSWSWLYEKVTDRQTTDRFRASSDFREFVCQLYREGCPQDTSDAGHLFDRLVNNLSISDEQLTETLATLYDAGLNGGVQNKGEIFVFANSQQVRQYHAIQLAFEEAKAQENTPSYTKLRTESSFAQFASKRGMFRDMTMHSSTEAPICIAIKAQEGENAPAQHNQLRL